MHTSASLAGVRGLAPMQTIHGRATPSVTSLPPVLTDLYGSFSSISFGGSGGAGARDSGLSGTLPATSNENQPIRTSPR